MHACKTKPTKPFPANLGSKANQATCTQGVHTRKTDVLGGSPTNFAGTTGLQLGHLHRFPMASKAQGPEVRQEICFHGTFCHSVHVMEAGVAYDGVCEEDSKPRLSWWRFPLEIGDFWKVSLQF